MTSPVTVNARGLKCPLPVLKAGRGLRGMRAGERLILLADDPNTPKELAEFCTEAGYRLLESKDGMFLIQK